MLSLPAESSDNPAKQLPGGEAVAKSHRAAPSSCALPQPSAASCPPASLPCPRGTRRLGGPGGSRSILFWGRRSPLRSRGDAGTASPAPRYPRERLLPPPEHPGERRDPAAPSGRRERRRGRGSTAPAGAPRHSARPGNKGRAAARPGTSFPSPRDIKQTPKVHSPWVSPAGQPGFDLQPGAADGKVPSEGFGSGPGVSFRAMVSPEELCSSSRALQGNHIQRDVSSPLPSS